MFSSEHKVVYYSDGLWSVQQKSALTVTGMVHGGFMTSLCVWMTEVIDLCHTHNPWATRDCLQTHKDVSCVIIVIQVKPLITQSDPPSWFKLSFT